MTEQDIKNIVEKIKTEEQEEDLFCFDEVEHQEPVKQKITETVKTEFDKSLEKFIEEQLKKEEIQELKKQTEEKYWIESKYPSFEKIMELKQQYKNITLVEIGDQLEEAVFQIAPAMYIIKPMPQTMYQKFIMEYGAIAANITEFTKYSISECVLYPEIDNTDIEEMSVGVGDLLSNEIYKFSRFASTKKITRI